MGVVSCAQASDCLIWSTFLPCLRYSYLGHSKICVLHGLSMEMEENKKLLTHNKHFSLTLGINITKWVQNEIYMYRITTNQNWGLENRSVIQN